MAPMKVTLTLMIVAVAATLALCWPRQCRCATGSASAQKKIIISKETTYITGPLRPDGTVDYVAALNDYCSKGVTPQNNAAVLLWQAFGPHEVPEKARAEFLKRLGLAPLPEKADYLIHFGESYTSTCKECPPFGSEKRDAWLKNIDERFQKAIGRPWSREEFPVVAGYLDANEKPLALVIEATRQPKMYWPVVNGGEFEEYFGRTLMGTTYSPDIGRMRSAARLLRLRAMLRAHEGKIDSAWQDLLACHRLARLLRQQPVLVDLLVANTLEAIACGGDAALAQAAHMTCEQLKGFRADLRSLPPPPDAVEGFSFGERIFCLDGMRDGKTAMRYWDLELTWGCITKPTGEALKKLAADPRIDWNDLLRFANVRFDQLVEAFRRPTYIEQRDAVNKLAKELANAASQTDDPKALAKLLSPQTPAYEVSKQFANLAAYSEFDALTAIPACEARRQVWLDLADLALAMAEYHNDHGGYPLALGELSPKYVEKLPKDPFSEQDYRYRREGKGYLLYSVGMNGRDDGGREPKFVPGVGDSGDDDIAIRTPAETQ
jgi:hypothetical protein